MRTGLIFTLLFFSILPVAKSQTVTDTIGNTIVEISVAVDTSHFEGGYSSGPWDLFWGPDQKLWYTNKKNLCTYDPVTHIVDTILILPSGFIMSVATHSNFLLDPVVYLVVDTADYYGGGHILQLFKYDYSLAGDSLTNAQYILEWYHPGEHSGGRVIYGSDEKVYVTTAEYWVEYDTLFSNSGKVLRVNPDGTVPADNPRSDYTYTYGHRNPQGIVQVPNGNIFVSEYGQQWDELNLLQRNGYYGWIVYDGVSCFFNQDSCDYYDSTGTAIFPIDCARNPPSGIDYYNHGAIPEFNGLIQAITGALYQGLIVYTMNTDFDSVTTKSFYLTQEYGRVRDVCAAPDGSVYFIARDRDKAHIRVIRNPLFTDNPEVNSQEIFTVYPNPAGDYLNFHLDFQGTGRISIADLTGKTLITKNITDKSGSIDISILSAGCYFVSLQSDNLKGIYKRRVVVN